MKQRILIWRTAAVLLLSVSLLAVGMLHIFATDPPAQELEDNPLAPDIEPTTVGQEGEPTPSTEQTVVNDGTVPMTMEQLKDKFDVYTHISEENGKRVATLFTPEQIAEINASRSAGETMLLTGQEMLYLLDNTQRLFEEYDLVRVTDLDGTVYSYPGVSFYSSEEFFSAFSSKVGVLATGLSYDLKNDAYEAMIYRIKVLHSYSEYICYVEDQECMYTYTEWDGIEGEDPRSLAEGITRHDSYHLRFAVAKNYMEGDTGDDNGRYPEIPVHRLNLIRSTPGAMLAFYGENIYYIDDMSAFDGTNLTVLYPDGIFPGGTVTGKYENGDGQSVIIELWEEATGNCIARLRLDSEHDAAEVQKIAALWDGMKDIRTRGGENLGAVGEGDYRVAVYLSGFPHKLLEGGSEQACFWYKPGADADLWSLIWWDDVMNFFSDNYVGGQQMTEYINSILKARLTIE